MEKFDTGTLTGFPPAQMRANDTSRCGDETQPQRYWGVTRACAASHESSATVTLDYCYVPSDQPLVLTDSDVVRQLHELTGLSWEQLARLIGVSRRSMHFWASGGTVNKRHSERLRLCLNMIREYGVIPPELVRSKLFTADVDGINDFDRFRLSFRSKPINGTVRKAADLLEGPKS